MSRRDPFSTPARRRRIIAEVAKKTLKLYCIKACDNVIWIRHYTAAALTVQCAFRSYVSRRVVAQLRWSKRHRASLRIQTRVRIKLACRKVERLRAALLLKQQIRLAQVITNLRNARKNRMAWLAFLVAKKIAREKRQLRAAIDIERVYRGHMARTLFRRMFQAHHAKIRTRNTAAVRMQSHIRRYLAVKSYRYWSTRRKSARIIYKYVMKWWLARKQRRRIAAMKLQCNWRAHVGRTRANTRRAELAAQRERVHEQVSMQLQMQLLRDVIQELILQTATALLPQERSMDIHVDLSSALVQKMCAEGPKYVIEWCIENSIVSYSRTSGYQSGAVVMQVVRSVELALHSEPSSAATNSTDTSSDEKVIALSKWDEGENAISPDFTILPKQWMQTVYDTLHASSSTPVGAGVSVESVSDKCIQLHIATLQETRPITHRPTETNEARFSRNVITIVFNAITGVADPTSTTHNTPNSNSEDSKSHLNEMKFRFKNALVYVDNPKPPPVIEEEPIIAIDEDSDDEEVIEVVQAVEEAKVRPTTAVVRIVLRDPTPPPPPIDYDAKALILQMLLRRRYLHRTRFARRIQRAVRRGRLVYLWQEAVYSVLEIAHDAATIVQCWLRRAAAQRLLQRLRVEYERAHFVYGHDFSLSEEANWAAFGMPVSWTDSDNVDSATGSSHLLHEALCRNPVVHIPIAACADDHINGNGGSVTSSVEAQRLLQLMRPPPAAEVLRLIEYPAPPPGCLYMPYTKNVDSLQHTILAMVRLSDRVHAPRPASESGSIAPQAPAAETGFSRTGCLHHLAVRQFIGDTSSDTTEIDLPIVPLAEQQRLLWRQHHLGDFSVDTTAHTALERADARLLSGAIDWNDHANVYKSQQKDNANRAAPIYAQLACKFR